MNVIKVMLSITPMSIFISQLLTSTIKSIWLLNTHFS